MFNTNFSVVQLMYRPLRGYSQTIPYHVVSVQTFRLDYNTSCGLGYVRHKFHGCTVDVQAATGLLTISTLP